MKKKKETAIVQKNVSFKRLVYEALPEAWTFHMLTATVLAAVSWVMLKIMSGIAETAGGALTTANIRDMLLSWRGPVLFILGMILVFSYVVVELLSKIYLCSDIFGGKRASIIHELKMGICSLKRFATPFGLLVIVFILIAVPLTGIGFSISLTRSFRIPNFILDVVVQKTLYAVSYIILLLLLVWAAYRYCFTLHAVLLDGLSPSEGMKKSAEIIKKHGKKLAFSLTGLCLILVFIRIMVYMLFQYLPGVFIERMGSTLPHDLVIDVEKIAETGMISDTEGSVILYRTLSAFVVLMGGYLYGVTTMLCSTYFMLRFTRYYLDFTGKKKESYPERPKKSRYCWKLIVMIAVSAGVALSSLVLGICYNVIIEREEPVKIIAHRAGGTMASENSKEGLELAIEQGCYASEIDVQRTKDGHYIVNHDDDFKRLTGVAKAPGEMTMDEIKELKIADTTGNGESHSVVTIEEMLDIIKGKEKLFIELKGKTADQRMVDDIVKIVKEKDCVSDVVLISLSYKVIDYAETNYPEFETGTLFFAGIGNVANLNCDLLIMEEKMATEIRINQIHSAGKTAVVWTVNSKDGMQKFLDSNIDAVITDEIELALLVREELDSRTEFEVLEARLEDIWED